MYVIRRASVFAIGVLGLVAGAVTSPAGALAAPAPTTTRYMTTTDPTVLYQEGCNQTNESGIVILDFGEPWFDGTLYGTIVFGSNTFRSVADIETGVKGWLRGYWNCGGAGSVRLAVGTSNYGGHAGAGHGAAWAQMVTELNDWVVQPPSWSARESVRGADDLEPSWSPPSAARAWVDAYGNASHFPFYNYGSADGCPPYGACTNGWTEEDLWYVAYGATAAWPIPEIYSSANAQQWYHLGLYGAVNHGSTVQFLGTLTQWAAAGSCCTNSPEQGWQQLADALDADSRTAQTLPYSTDITWAN
jgi:hypothetical protein